MNNTKLRGNIGRVFAWPAQPIPPALWVQVVESVQPPLSQRCHTSCSTASRYLSCERQDESKLSHTIETMSQCLLLAFGLTFCLKTMSDATQMRSLRKRRLFHYSHNTCYLALRNVIMFVHSVYSEWKRCLASCQSFNTYIHCIVWINFTQLWPNHPFYMPAAHVKPTKQKDLGRKNLLQDWQLWNSWYLLCHC